LEIGVAGSVAKKVWRKPEVKAMSAGSAERGQAGQPDGQGQQQS
jgi:hypothetical protein